MKKYNDYVFKESSILDHGKILSKDKYKILISFPLDFGDLKKISHKVNWDTIETIWIIKAELENRFEMGLDLYTLDIKKDMIILDYRGL